MPTEPTTLTASSGATETPMIAADDTKDSQTVLKEAFALIDKNHNGIIDKQEMLLALRPGHEAYSTIANAVHLKPLLQPRHMNNTFKEMATKIDFVVALSI